MARCAARAVGRGYEALVSFFLELRRLEAGDLQPDQSPSQGDPIVLVRDSFKHYIEALGIRFCFRVSETRVAIHKAVLQHLTELQRTGEHLRRILHGCFFSRVLQALASL